MKTILVTFTGLALLAANPSAAQMHGGGFRGGDGVHVGGGFRGGGHAGGVIRRPIHGDGDAGRGGGHNPRAGQRAGQIDMRRDGFHQRQGHDGHGFRPGGFVFGYGYPVYAESYDDYAEPYDNADDEFEAREPADQPRYRRHDPNACAEWDWVAAKRQYVCTRRAF